MEAVTTIQPFKNIKDNWLLKIIKRIEEFYIEIYDSEQTTVIHNKKEVTDIERKGQHQDTTI